MLVRLLSATLLAIGLGACSKAPAPTPADGSSLPATAEEPGTDEPAETTPPPLSEEDRALLAADPSTLSPEDRRKRAYALRRKIMQNPDSPAARMLEDLQQAHKSGALEVPAKGSGPVFSLPGKKPQGTLPPAGYRPPPEQAQ